MDKEHALLKSRALPRHLLHLQIFGKEPRFAFSKAFTLIFCSGHTEGVSTFSRSALCKFLRHRAPGSAARTKRTQSREPTSFLGGVFFALVFWGGGGGSLYNFYRTVRVLRRLDM